MTSPANATPEARSQSSTDTELKEPGRFHVIFLNDDYTPMDFVQKLLQEIFYHDIDTSSELTKLIHEKGKGVAGTYVHEIAEQKAIESTTMARSAGHPLNVTVEAE
jgi:ATP-dependent Clp protease adaptor protein ClpS